MPELARRWACGKILALRLAEKALAKNTRYTSQTGQTTGSKQSQVSQNLTQIQRNFGYLLRETVRKNANTGLNTDYKASTDTRNRHSHFNRHLQLNSTNLYQKPTLTTYSHKLHFQKQSDITQSRRTHTWSLVTRYSNQPLSTFRTRHFGHSPTWRVSEKGKQLFLQTARIWKTLTRRHLLKSEPTTV